MSYREELAEQATVLEALLVAGSQCIYTTGFPEVSSFSRIVFSGMGSSYFAGIYGAILFNRGGKKAVAVEASELSVSYRSLLDKDTLLVAISQSGQSSETLELVKSVDGVNTLVVTNKAGGELAQTARCGWVDIIAGEEKTTSTKTYTNTLAALFLLARHVFGISISGWKKETLDALDIMRSWLSHVEKLGREIWSFLSGVKYLVYMGSGFSHVSASHAALITGEMSGELAAVTTVGEFFHGLIEQVDQRYGFIAFNAASFVSPDFQKACSQVVEAGGRLVRIGGESELLQGEKHCLHIRASFPKDLFACWAEIVPVECFAYIYSLERGRDPGVLQRVQKQ